MKALSVWLGFLGTALGYLSWRLWWLIEETHGASAFRNALSRVRAGLRQDEQLLSIVDHVSQQIHLIYIWLDVFLLVAASVAVALLVSACMLFLRASRTSQKQGSPDQ